MGLQAKHGGTSDFWLEDVVYTRHKQQLDLKLLEENSAFTVLCDWEILAGYSETYSIRLDAFSCGETPGNFTNAIRFGNYNNIAMAYFRQVGSYAIVNDDAGLRKRGAVRYDPAQSQNSWARILGGKTSAFTKEFPISSANAVIGGENGVNSSPNQNQGIVHGLYVYKRALLVEEIDEFVDNGIIP